MWDSSSCSWDSGLFVIILSWQPTWPTSSSKVRSRDSLPRDCLDPTYNPNYSHSCIILWKSPQPQIKQILLNLAPTFHQACVNSLYFYNCHRDTLYKYINTFSPFLRHDLNSVLNCKFFLKSEFLSYGCYSYGCLKKINHIIFFMFS